mmetsp:Transcript_9779/g.24902  ORF Transcript_9779/g.24902 Transcript_9779/m.24902 type:complete len:170 (+) Transcript_9779:310-819(+)
MKYSRDERRLPRTPGGASLLHTAAKEGQAATVKEVLSMGAHVNSVDKGMTALHLAARNHHSGVVQILLQQRADINKRSIEGRCPLHIAAYEGVSEIVRQLVDAGAEVRAEDPDGYTPFQLASMKHNNFQSMEVILEKLVKTYDPNRKHAVYKTFNFKKFKKEVDGEQDY